MRALWLAGLAALAVTLPPEWLHNPRERTASGVRAWERGDGAAAARAFDEALELGDAGDARLTFNAGTGHLAAGAPGAAMPLLERAAAVDGPLRPDALYNLGNARLQSGDAAGAIDAYEACLRLAPDHTAAKHNLELALRRVTEQQQAPQPQPGGGGGEGEPQPQAPDEGAEQPGEEEQPGGEQGGGDPQQPPAGGEQQRQRSPRLPQFDPQEDMSAEQAAALLEAVENLEREQRRAQAEERRRQRRRSAVEKDW